MSGTTPRFSIVMLTHNRCGEALRSLAHLVALPECPAVCLVDNASSDGTSTAVARAYPAVRIVRLPKNMGAAGRNAGVLAARTPYVAFCDDDTWWAPGSLTVAADALDAHRRLAAVTARVLVGPEAREDETSVRMAASPLRNALGVPGRPVLGVMAGACMMRRSAYLEVGGYDPRLFIGGEELLLALDLMTAGWAMSYLHDAVVHHHPSGTRDRGARRRMAHRNALWCTWLRRPWRSAVPETASLLLTSVRDAALALGLLDALRGMPAVLARRTPIPPHVEAALRQVREFYSGDWMREALQPMTPRAT